MEQQLRVALAQINLLVGDVEGNAEKIIAAAADARERLQANVVLFPELTLTGYPPEDLLLRPVLQQCMAHAIELIKQQSTGITLMVGFPHKTTEGLFNAVGVICNGEILAIYHKQHLPNYSVFDEKRYFVAGTAPCVVDVAGVRMGVTICEDIWRPETVNQSRAAGAQIILNLNASPFHLGKGLEREAVLAQRSTEAGIPIIYVNLVGGQDELVFDGGSFVVDRHGNVTQRAPAFEEGLYCAEFVVDDDVVKPVLQSMLPVPGEEASVYQALVLGVRDYIRKNGFPGAVIGLSGGIDSALTLAVAVDAIGREKVEAVMLPSRYTSRMSLEDAREEAHTLGVAYRVISIEPTFVALLESLVDVLGEKSTGVTEENIQARCRGTILMALSNEWGKIVLTTGNKSEMAVGYATLYGDMVGGFAALKDVSKTMVYRLARYRNSLVRVIPQRIIERPPSAELAPNQRDSDSLPDYGMLDHILDLYIEQDRCRTEIIAAGFDAATVDHVIRLVDMSEYKRRQAAPGVRITRRAFGRDRRYPITSGSGRGQLTDC